MSSANNDIAIIGYSCTLPGGENIYESWDMILSEMDNLRDLPDNRSVRVRFGERGGR